MDHRLLEIVACPVCNGKLYFNKENQNWCAKRTGWLTRCATAFRCCWKMKRVRCRWMRSTHEFYRYYSRPLRLDPFAG